MSRKARFDEEGYFYHIICRGQRKNPLFFSPVDRFEFFNILNSILDKHDVEIYAYCLMTNHFHMLVRRNSQSLHTFMKQLNTKYAMYFNRHYGLVGHVFQDRYISRAVLEEKYLFNIIQYIHLNPVKAEIVIIGEKYKYSSASAYVFNETDKNIPRLRLLGGFSTKIDYLVGVETSAPFPMYKDIIGTDEEYFKLEKRKETRSFGRTKMRRKGEKEDLKIIVNEMLKSENLTRNEVFGKNRRMFKAEKLKIIKLLLERGFTKKEICREFERHPSWVNNILKNS